MNSKEVKEGNILTLAYPIYWGRECFGNPGDRVIVEEYNTWPNGDFKSIKIKGFFGLLPKETFVEFQQERESIPFELTKEDIWNMIKGTGGPSLNDINEFIKLGFGTFTGGFNETWNWNREINLNEFSFEDLLKIYNKLKIRQV